MEVGCRIRSKTIYRRRRLPVWWAEAKHRPVNHSSPAVDQGNERTRSPLPMPIIYLSLLYLDAFVEALEAGFRPRAVARPKREGQKPTVIILE
jgi:hypothetical protein